MQIQCEYGADYEAKTANAIDLGLGAASVRDSTVVLTRDFDMTVRRLTGSHTYSGDRNSGYVLAKTLVEPAHTVVLNQIAIERQRVTLAEIERTMAHEGCHVLMFDRRESATFHHDLAGSQEEFNMMHLGGEVIEEYRCELTVIGVLGYPTMRACSSEDLGRNLHNANVDLVEALIDPASQDVHHLQNRILGSVATPLAKTVAVTAAGAADPCSMWVSNEDWLDYVQPVWQRRQEFFEQLPPAQSEMDRTAYRAALRESGAIEKEGLQAIGFEYQTTDAGETVFRRTLPDANCRERLARAERRPK